MMNIYYRSRFHNFAYRLGQVREQLGFVAPLTAQDYKEVAALLPTAAALSLFRTMSPADQQHSLRVCRKLLARGCKDKDMLAAALLHDVGKAQGRVPFWTRPAIVLGKKLAPQLLTRLVIYPEKGNEEPLEGDGRPGRDARPARPNIPHWRLSLCYAWYHADIGADLASAAGLSERAVLYIRTHHQPGGPAAELHEVDEVS
ncbi:MAG TPA: HD domain-containing protein [Ktedonobacteraceae bacterium]